MSQIYKDNARRNVEGYTAQLPVDGVIRESKHAIDCMDCEAFIDCGIESFRFLMHVDEKVRESVYDGRAEFDASFDDFMRSLLEQWLAPVPAAERWVKSCQSRGCKIDRLSGFRECVAQARAMTRDDADDLLPEALVGLRDKALEEYRNGETTEMFSEE